MLQEILAQLAETKTQLVAVSKTKSEEQILEMYRQGQRKFGENRVQELVDKQAGLPQDIEWHAIGHLQTNKVKYIVPFVALIHSVDSLRLLKEINKQARRHERVIDCLLQMKIAEEDSKYGLSEADAQALLNSQAFQQMEHVRILGLMGMATFTEDETQIRQEFRHLKSCFDQFKKDFFSDQPTFKEISMGMSGDYRIAQEEGSTMVRIGSLLFGPR